MAPKIPRNSLVAVLICCLGVPFRFGFHLSATNPTDALLRERLNATICAHYGQLDDGALAWVWSLTCGVFFLSATFGALAYNLFGHRMKRRTGLLVSQILFIVGSFVAASAYFETFELFFVGQVIYGAALGFGGSVLTLFIEEISHASYAGTFFTLIALTIEVGTLIANVVGINVILGRPSTWPLIWLLPVPLNVICIVFLLFFAHETPPRLLKEGRKEEAIKSLRFYCGLEEATAIQRLTETERQYTSAGSQMQRTMWQALSNRANWRPLFLSALTNTTTNFSGIMAIAMFGATIFGKVGLNETQAGIANAGVFASSLVGLIFAIFFVGDFSHRLLLADWHPGDVEFDVLWKAILMGAGIVVFCLAFSNSVEKVMWFNGSFKLSRTCQSLGANYTPAEFLEANSSITLAVTYFTAFLAPLLFFPAMEAWNGWSFMLFIPVLVFSFVVFLVWYPKEGRVRPTAQTAPEAGFGDEHPLPLAVQKESTDKTGVV
ncbi:Solute carrier family 2, facilitated glucose transporter member 1-like isoform X3 [Aphelenchoides fujianensis]|nr:Solute carrier family 2, facilitated glucose transporter member 1-like isoform X3 [Aphelenchoides fujianensis]